VRECLVLTMSMTILGGMTAPRPDACSEAVIESLVGRVSLAVDDLDVASILSRPWPLSWVSSATRCAPTGAASGQALG
jgi:hypothetical protein